MCVVNSTGLTLGKLEPFTGPRLSRLLAFDSSRVPSHQTMLPELFPVSFIDTYQRASHRQAERASLTRQTTTIYPSPNVESPQRVSNSETLLDM